MGLPTHPYGQPHKVCFWPKPLITRNPAWAQILNADSSNKEETAFCVYHPPHLTSLPHLGIA